MIKVKKLSQFPPNSNPFRHDSYHQGMDVGSNVCVMFGGTDKPLDYIIVVNLETGERIQVDFSENRTNKHLFTSICNARDGLGYDDKEEVVYIDIDEP